MKKYSNDLIKLKNLGNKKNSYDSIQIKNNGSNSLKDYSSQPIFTTKLNNNSKPKYKILHKSSSSLNENNENKNTVNLPKACLNYDSNKLKKGTNSGKNNNKVSYDSLPKPQKFNANFHMNSIGMDIDYPLKSDKDDHLSVIEEKNNSPKFDETILEEGTLSTKKDSDKEESPYTNPQIPYEYISDIFDNLLKEENPIQIKFESMKTQSDINDKMRAILIDWLIDVHLKFKLVPESLFLTINIIDRYISKKQILRSKLQLLGVAALLIACKYEEIYSPELRDFVYITDKAFSKSEIITMEQDVLLTLNFDLTIPSILRFLEIFAIKFNLREKDFALARYLVEIFLIDFRINKYSSSLVATTATYIVLKLNRNEKINEIFLFSRKSEPQLKECAKDILFLIQNIEGSVLQAVRKKFASNKYFEVSKMRFC
jgi:cyclin B